MISANELRIGNNVKYIYHIDPASTIRVIDGDHVLLNNEHADDYVLHDEIEPITLTDEILAKCGFEDKTYKPGYIGKEFHSNMILDFVLTKPKVLFELQDYYVFELPEHRIVPVASLHKLQNLFFSITGIELIYVP